MKRFILYFTFCLLCSVSQAANNFSADANCVALWRFENGALTTDSKGTNTLTVVFGSPVADTVNYKEGAASVDFEVTDSDRVNIDDVDLDAGYPFKNGDATKNFSVCFWYKPESFPGASGGTIYAKGAGGLETAWIRTPTDGKLEFYIFTTTWELAEFGTAMVAGTWYHVGVTYQNSDKSYRVRIWDDGASAQLGVDKTGSFSGNINVTTGVLGVGTHAAGGANVCDGLIDEIVVFNDVLTADEIDQMRGGTYGPPPPAGGGQVIIIEME